MGLFFASKVYTTTVQGMVERDYDCEKCTCNFRTRFRHEGVGKGQAVYGLGRESARRRSAAAAEEGFEKSLARIHPHFPCPACGWYQSEMNEYYRRMRFGLTYAYTLLATFLLLVIVTGVGIMTFRDQGWPGLRSEVLSSPLFITWLLASFTLLGVLSLIRKNSDLNESAPPPSATLVAED